jgi:hypothetical protein
MHDSGEEASYCVKLGILKKCGEIRDYTTQKTFRLHDAVGKECGSMRVDFVVTKPDGKIEIREYKGALFLSLREFKLARALFSWNYPDLNYVTVTERDLV